MKILVISQRYYPEPFRICDICKELVLKGHEVHVVTGVPNYPIGKAYEGYEHGKKKDEVVDGVSIHRCFTFPMKKGFIGRCLNYFSFPVTAGAYVLKLANDFDAVYVYSVSPVLMGIPAVFYKKKNKKPLIVYNMDIWPECLLVGGIKREGLVYKLFRKISGYVYKNADSMLCSSLSFIEYFEKQYNINRSILKYCPQYDDGDFSDMMTPENKKSSTYNFVYAGNIGMCQSVETIVKAAEILKERKDIYFHVVGNGVMYEKCKALAEPYGNITFYGRKSPEELKKYYAMADALLITFQNTPVASFTLPAKMQTYMNVGKPVLGAVEGETRAVIETANCGICCNFENAEGLAEAVLKFIASNNKEDMAKNAKTYYNKYFTKEIFFNCLENAFENTEYKAVRKNQQKKNLKLEV